MWLWQWRWGWALHCQEQGDAYDMKQVETYQLVQAGILLSRLQQDLCEALEGERCFIIKAI